MTQLNPLVKTSNPLSLLATLIDPKTVIAVVSILFVWLSTHMQLQYATTPDERKTISEHFTEIVGTVVSVLLAALGYQHGKSVEGTVPDGFQSATATNFISGVATELKEFAPSAVKLLFLFFIPALLLTGCTGTSAPYSAGIKPAVSLVCGEMTNYTKANTVLNAAQKASEQLNTDALNSTVSGKVDAQKVTSAWSLVEPTYKNYVYSDSSLGQADKDMIWQTAQKIDALNADELTRQRDWMSAFVNSFNAPATMP